VRDNPRVPSPTTHNVLQGRRPASARGMLRWATWWTTLRSALRSVQGPPCKVHDGFAAGDLGGAGQVGRLENVLGWYHSHPGYGCWLSGIDVATQLINQQHQDPFLAVVVRMKKGGCPGAGVIFFLECDPLGALGAQVDPVRTAAAGRVELGAFRCYPAVRKASPCRRALFQGFIGGAVWGWTRGTNRRTRPSRSTKRSRLRRLRILASTWTRKPGGAGGKGQRAVPR
jgi:hypothetical protein